MTEINQEQGKAERAYYTVNVYKHSGIGQEASFENILADSPEDAMARVAGSNPWLRHNPMHAFEHDSRYDLPLNGNKPFSLLK